MSQGKADEIVSKFILYLPTEMKNSYMDNMATAVPVPPPPARGVTSRRSKHRRSLWRRLRRRRDFWRLISTAALWLFTVCAVWLILKQVIK